LPDIYNRHNKNCPIDAVYIGRNTPWGNPYEIGKDGSRHDVCNKFIAYVENHPTLKADIKKYLKGKDLKCSCKPARCHGDYLLRIANE
jgi:hypothetical protein